MYYIVNRKKKQYIYKPGSWKGLVIFKFLNFIQIDMTQRLNCQHGSLIKNEIKMCENGYFEGKFLNAICTCLCTAQAFWLNFLLSLL